MPLAKEPVLSREVHIAGTIVLVDGIARSGKSLLAPVLGSFDRVEMERMEEILEHLTALYSMNKIAEDATTSLLKLMTDIHLYYSMIGRNTNFRFSDHSSVWKNPNRLRYFKRLFKSDGPQVLERIRQDKPIHQTHTHDQMGNFPVLHQAFGDRLRIVQTIRHPVDLIDSWFRKGWGVRFGTDPLALTLTVRHEDQDLPFYAIGWESEYLEATPYSRIVGMVSRLWDHHRAVYKGLPSNQKTQIFFIPLEDFVQRPFSYTNPMGGFLGSRPTSHTKKALKRQRCPRAYSVEAREVRQTDLLSQLSQDDQNTVSRLIEDYETFTATIFSELEQ